MDLEYFRQYCLSKKGVEETFPFDEVTLVFKVMGKMFAITGLDNPDFSVSLKCDPERSIELRETFEEIKPAWHMSKIHWNMIDCQGAVEDSLLRELIDHSYNLVVAGLPKKLRTELEQLE